ncbi:unnamed protein product [Paramecium pentaurelia]|uniref:Uncharacterized protein n=1 Tax=Paramecium pentaurelia TaxID=43138 RepID=A0A8S1YKA3_9CILI|nr:unnamed protein product [Paramecium pentaurelia]
MVVHPLKEDLIIAALLIKQSIFDQIDFLQLRVLNEMIYGLSINNEENTLISCGKDNQILIMQGSRQMEWQIKQKIILDGEGYRIVFITNGLFAFQSRIPRNRLFLYQLDENTQVFNKLQDIIVEGLVYIYNKQILISKKGQKVNFLTKWLAIWYCYAKLEVFDNLGSNSKNIQIRSYQETIIKQEQTEYILYIFQKLLKILLQSKQNCEVGNQLTVLELQQLIQQKSDPF